MSRKSAAVGTGDICFRPLVDMTVKVRVPRGSSYVSTTVVNEGPMDVGVSLVGVVEDGVQPSLRYGVRFGKSGAKIWIR